MQQPTLDLTALRNAMVSLDSARGVVGDAEWFGRQSQAAQQTLVAGVIQNFEFVYEPGVKTLRRQLELEADVAEEIDQAGFRDMLRMAAERGLIDDVAAWFNWRRMCNLGAHTYNQEKALEVFRETTGFAVDARTRMSRLETRYG